MKKRFKTPEDRSLLRDKIIGLGERSIRKSYYPELQARLTELETANARLKQGIDERKRTENALKESETRFRDLADLLPAGIIETDTEGNLVYVNRHALEQFGYSQHDFDQGLNAINMIALDGRPSAIENMSRVLKGEYSDLSEYIFVRKDKSTFPGIIQSTAIVHEGKVFGLRGTIIDITERKLTEEALKESEEKYRTLVENQTDLVVKVDLEGRFLFASPSYCRMFGRTEEELLGHSFMPLVHEEDRETTTRTMENLYRPPYSEYLEQRAMTKDGWRWLAWADTAVLDEEGHVVEIIGVGRDITERKQAEEALKESEEKMRSIFRAAPVGIGVVSNRVILEVNDRICEMTGYSKEELIGKNARILYSSDDDYEYVGREKYRQIEERGTGTVETRFKCKDGEIIYVLLSSTPIDPTNHSVGVTFTALDITERKRAEEALAKRIMVLTQPLDDAKDIIFEELFNLDDIQRLQDEFAKATGVASIITRPDGTPITKPSNFCRLCNDIIRQTDKGLMNCYTSDASIGRHNPQGPIIKPCLSGGLCNAGASITVGGKHIANWLIGQVRDGTQTEEKMREYAREIGADEVAVVAAFREVPVMSHENFGKVAQTLFTLAGQLSTTAYQNVQQARFITERKRAEEEKEKLQAQLQQAKKIEAVGTLAGGIAHDFNNLLQAIIGYTQLILLDTAEGSVTYANLNDILAASQRAKELIRQLLLFSRKLETKKKPINLNQKIEQAITILERTIPKMIDIRLHLDRQLWPINADPIQIEQILLNLGANAADSMPDGGKLIIETENVNLDEDFSKIQLEAKPGNYVLITVSDTGHGMDQETVEHVFEPFFTTKEIGKGTGLGLASAYGIVKSHDGFMTCSSEVGHGTIFKIYVPVIEEADTEEGKDVAAKLPKGGTETILLVDDEEPIRDFVSKLLIRFGYIALTASSGEEALKIYTNRPNEIDLVIMDIGMPGMGGHKCLCEIVRFDPSAKVLISSGYSINGQVKKTLEAGALGYVGKPYQLADLLEKVRAIFDQED